jgi:hypothetical protein
LGHHDAHLQRLGEDADHVYSKQIKESSRSQYQRAQVRLILWLYDMMPDVISDDVRADLNAIANEKDRRAYIRTLLGPPVNLNRPPLKLTEITPKKFLMYICDLKKKGADATAAPAASEFTPSLTFQTYSSHRAALFNLFRDFKTPMSEQFKMELASHFKGLRRHTAAKTQEGALPLKVGKDPFPFSLYRWLCLELLKLGTTSEMVVARCQVSLAWNLMCRVSNCVDIKLSHIEWIEDALVIYFATQKNDQGGERPRDPKHLYANPLQPDVCCVLGLAILLMCFPLSETGKLFPGDNQDDRLGNTIRRALESQSGKHALEVEGREAKDFGTHSLRKGATTFVSSGSTACPPAAAIQRRGGWTMGHILDVYIRFEAAGDQFVGRSVAGLPSMSPKFGILPPFFVISSPQDRIVVNDAVRLCFHGLPDRLFRVAEQCLASCVYHSEWLLQQLPSNHLLFTTPLFRDPALRARLQQLIVCRFEEQGDPMRATGIPPHTALLGQMERLLDEFKALRVENSAMTSNVVKDVKDAIIQELEARAMVAGTLTRDGLKTILNEMGFIDVMERLRAGNFGPSPPQPPVPPPIPVTSGPKLWTWGGKLRRLPEDFTVPTMTPLSAWQLWCCGDKAKQYPPFLNIQGCDLSDANKRRRISDIATVCKAISSKALDLGLAVQQPMTVEQANIAFDRAFPELHLFEDEQGNEVERSKQWTVLTACKKLRQRHPKRARVANDDGDEAAASPNDGGAEEPGSP